MPIFMKLENEPCLVVGGGKIALQKIYQLVDCKALVTAVSPKISKSISSLPVTTINRRYQTSDLEGVKLVIAATDDKEVNQKIFEDSNRRGLLVNVVDKPNLCSFYMGSVFQDGDLKVAVSTNGKCPSFGTYIRDHIKNFSKGLWGKALDDLAIKREQIIKTLSNYTDKKEIIGRLVRKRLKENGSADKIRGKIFLVGAGPGDPELITTKGLRAIQSADVILHDALVHPHLVFEINPLAKKIFVGKREDKHSVTQETIHLIMIEEAAKGRQVVRLKGGDPFIFGRGGEEAMSLAEADVAFEVVPGVTAGLGAAAGFGIPLTHRDDATSTLFITGHQCRSEVSQDWETLAKLNSTLVFYMGMKRLGVIVSGLTKNGKPADTPVAIVQNATMVNQEILISTLKNISSDIENLKQQTPSVIIIGEVVNYYRKLRGCLNARPSQMTIPMQGVGFDIWQNKTVSA